AQKSPAGGWRLIADGSNANSFLDDQTLRATFFSAALNSPVQAAFHQTAPGRYEVDATINSPFLAAISRIIPSGSPQGPLVGQLRVPSVETTAWPASVEHSLLVDSLPRATMLNADPAIAEEWNTPALQPIPLSAACWIAASTVLVIALLLRR